MALARNLLARRLHSLLDRQNVAFLSHILHSNPPPSPPHRPFASSSQTLAESDRAHSLKSLHSLFQDASERRIDAENEKFKGKSKQGEAEGLLEKTGDKDGEAGHVKNVKKKKKPPQKKLRKSSASKVKFTEGGEEEEVQDKTKQAEAVSFCEKSEHERSEVQRVEEKKEA